MPRRHGKETVVYVDGYDISGYSSNFESQAQADVAEVTGYGDARKRYVVGHLSGMLNHDGWFDDTTDGVHDVIQSRLGQEAVVNAAWGDEVGAAGVGGSAMNVKAYNVNSPIAAGVGVHSEYESAGQTGLEYVEVLQNKGSVGATTTGKDDGALSSNGLRAYLQVFEILAGTPVYVLQHSTALATGYAGLATFSGFDAVGAEVVAAAGTVNEFLRLTVSGGSAVIWLGYRRLTAEGI